MKSSDESLSADDALELMSQLLDGELSAADAETLNAYLQIQSREIAWMESLDLAFQVVYGDPHASGLPDPNAIVRKAVGSGPQRERNTAKSILPFPSWMVAAAAAAAMVLAGVLTWDRFSNPAEAESQYVANASVVEYVDTDLPRASTAVFTDESSGWTVVWVTSVDPLPEPTG